MFPVQLPLGNQAPILGLNMPFNGSESGNNYAQIRDSNGTLKLLAANGTYLTTDPKTPLINTQQNKEKKYMIHKRFNNYGKKDKLSLDQLRLIRQDMLLDTP